MSIKVVIPMSGLGSRFVAAGFHDPKPLIEVQGRPMIEWVLRMFPTLDDVLFICRREHAENTKMLAVLKALRPHAEIAVIEGAKLGPVDALMKARDKIPDGQPILVSYCDFFMHWDCAGFLNDVKHRQPEGSIPCYTGFHPHLLPEKNLYASCRIDAEQNLIEIREKHSFDSDKTKARHSPGTYYFGSGVILKYYSDMLIRSGETLNGEYYVSMIYNNMVLDGMKVFVPASIPNFCQWGTPEDLGEYLYWTERCRRWAV